MTLVWDSNDLIETTIAELYPDVFNGNSKPDIPASETPADLIDKRSDNHVSLGRGRYLRDQLYRVLLCSDAMKELKKKLVFQFLELLQRKTCPHEDASIDVVSFLYHFLKK